MLQPVDWSRSPDDLLGNVSPARLSVFRTIWDSAIAVTLKAPVLKYTRTLARGAGGTVAVMSVEAMPGRSGYWPFRQDCPASLWPTALIVPQGATLTVTAALPAQYKALSLGGLVTLMESRSIGTPATVANLLQGAIEPSGQRPASLVLKNETVLDAPGFRHLVNLSPFGKENLALWRSHGLVGNSVENRAQIEAVASGDLTTNEVLRSRFPDLDSAVVDRITENIAQSCHRWQGLSREEGLRSLMKQQAKPPKLSGLPGWIDPEKLLAKDHPLRTLRDEMEFDLAVRYPAWEAMVSSEKVVLRKGWLQANRARHPLIPDFENEATRFNAIAYWLLGCAF